MVFTKSVAAIAACVVLLLVLIIGGAAFVAGQMSGRAEKPIIQAFAAAHDAPTDQQIDTQRLTDEAIASKLYQQSGDPVAFRQQLTNIQSRAASQKQQVGQDFFNQTGKLPSDPVQAAVIQFQHATTTDEANTILGKLDPNQRALATYYLVMDQNQLPGGGMNYDALDTQLAGIQSKWTPAQQAYVDTQTGLKTHSDPTVAKYYEDSKTIANSGYWQEAANVYQGVAKNFGVQASNAAELQNALAQKYGPAASLSAGAVDVGSGLAVPILSPEAAAQTQVLSTLLARRAQQSAAVEQALTRWGYVTGTTE